MTLNKQKGNMWIFPYLAGFIDGEGWIGIAKQVRSDRPSPTYRGQIKISNQKKGPLQLCKSIYAGQITESKDCFVWCCPSSSIPKCRKDISPFLIIKKEQAKLLLSFHTFAKAIRNNSRQIMSSCELETKEYFYSIMKKLNQHNFRSDKYGFK